MALDGDFRDSSSFLIFSRRWTRRLCAIAALALSPLIEDIRLLYSAVAGTCTVGRAS